EQAVVNLLNNAAKYSEDGGRVQLSARNNGAEVVLTVRDEGIGIPPERLTEMFDLFVQGDRSLARAEGGLGIGLTVGKRLVEMHGGLVAARSEGPGSGCEFVIRLPSVAKPESEDPTARGPTEEAAREARILVVDDNIDMVSGMAMLLEKIGYEVATSHD